MGIEEEEGRNELGRRATMSRIEEEINENTHRRVPKKEGEGKGKKENSDVNRKRRMGGCSSEIDH